MEQRDLRQDQHTATLSAGHNRLYTSLEIVSLSSLCAYIVPVAFLCVNMGYFDMAKQLIVAFVLLAVGGFILYLLLTSGVVSDVVGSFLRLDKWLSEDGKISPVIIKLTLYSWAGFSLLLICYLVFITGGLANSIFVWLFEVTFIIVLIIRENKWRPIIIIGGFECLLIVLLGIFHPMQIPEDLANSMSMWGGFSIISALVITLFAFLITDTVNKRKQEV